MTRLQWLCIGTSAGVAGALAVSLALAPTTPTAAPVAVSAPAVAPAPQSVATPAPAPVVAAAPVARKAPRVAKPAAFAPAEAGMVIAIDPETGEVGMPTTEQRAALGLDQDAVSRDIELTPVVHPDGRIELDLRGTMQDYAVVRLDKNGKPVVGCVQHPNGHVDTSPAGLEEE